MSRFGFLFDLDGTLVDTAGDLVPALNRMLVDAGRPIVPYAIARNEVSNGALGLLQLGFGLRSEVEPDPGLRADFLDIYQKIGHSNSRFFIDLQHLSQVCSDLDASWGIVTNKPQNLTRSLLESLGVADQPAAIVCGDTLPQRKPHPAPMLHAAGNLSVPPDRCIYVGDALRDIEAGRAAGMRTIAATWGYIRPGESVASWEADAVVSHPRRIGAMLQTMTQLDP